MTVSCFDTREVEKRAKKEALKRILCELIDDATGIEIETKPELRRCLGSIADQFSTDEPIPGISILTLKIESGIKHPVFRRTEHVAGRDTYEIDKYLYLATKITR